MNRGTLTFGYLFYLFSIFCFKMYKSKNFSIKDSHAIFSFKNIICDYKEFCHMLFLKIILIIKRKKIKST